MRDAGRFNAAGGLRVIALAGVLVLGLAGIIGSMPATDEDFLADCCTYTLLMATVQPARATAQVGGSVTYSAEAINAPGEVGYQWRRSYNGGRTWSNIAGATGRTFSTGPVGLADDGAIFEVKVTAADGQLAWAQGRLAVSSYAGVVFEDGEFRTEDWLATPIAEANAAVPAHAEEQVATGGKPGAWRKMTFTIPAQAGVARVLYTSLVAGYDPLRDGAIHVIDYAEDGRALTPNLTFSTLLLEQAGRIYLANPFGSAGLSSQWSGGESRSSLGPPDFTQIGGTPCQAGESCPDFSSAGLPMRFGYWRHSYGAAGASVVHGIDNWKVTVWKK